MTLLAELVLQFENEDFLGAAEPVKSSETVGGRI